MNTFCNGPLLKVGKDIYEDDMVAICRDLSDALSGGYRFIPDPYIKGGICTDVSDGNLCKSMDIYPVSDVDNPMFEKGNYLRTFLRAYKDAPSWTLDELYVLASVFSKYGITVSSYPRDKKLLPR